MTWTKIDDQFIYNQKVILAGKDARMLYVTALCYSSGQLTDGFINGGVLPLLGALADVDAWDCANRLVEVGLWEVRDAGYQIHDFLKYNPTAEQVKAQREADVARKAAWRAAHREADGAFTSSRNPGGIQSDPEMRHNRPDPVPDPDPVLPDPDPVPEAVVVGANAPIAATANPETGELVENDTFSARTPATRFYFAQFKPPRKRWKNRTQRDTFEAAECDVGYEIMARAIQWGMLHDAISVAAICTTARKMANDRASPNGKDKGHGNSPQAVHDPHAYTSGAFGEFIEH